MRCRLYVVTAGLMIASACGRIGFSQSEVLGTDAGASDGMGPVNGDSNSGVAMWHLTQANGAASGVVPITATTAGNLLLVGVHLDYAGSITAVHDNAPGGGNSYTEIAVTQSFNSANMDQAEMWYVPSTKAGATTVTVTVAGGTAFSAMVWEVDVLGASVQLEIGTVFSNGAATSLPKSPSIQILVPGSFVAAMTAGAGAVTGIHAGNAFTNDSIAGGDGWAHLTDTDTAPGNFTAEWDSASGTYCSAGVGFQLGP